MTFMNRIVLVNQTHTAQPVLSDTPDKSSESNTYSAISSDSRMNYTYEPILVNQNI